MMAASTKIAMIPRITLKLGESIVMNYSPMIPRTSRARLTRPMERSLVPPATHPVSSPTTVSPTDDVRSGSVRHP